MSTPDRASRRSPRPWELTTSAGPAQERARRQLRVRVDTAAWVRLHKLDTERRNREDRESDRRVKRSLTTPSEKKGTNNGRGDESDPCR